MMTERAKNSSKLAWRYECDGIIASPLSTPREKLLVSAMGIVTGFVLDQVNLVEMEILNECTAFLQKLVSRSLDRLSAPLIHQVDLNSASRMGGPVWSNESEAQPTREVTWGNMQVWKIP